MYTMFARLCSTKTLIRIAFAALSISTIASTADAASAREPHVTLPHGPYDNTGQGPQETGMEGGGG